MNLYERYVLPRLIDLVMQNKADRAERARFVPRASGTVLEVGFGSGLNLPFYGPEVARLYARDPSIELWRLARGRLARAAFPIEHLPTSGERIPLGDQTIDSVVGTWTLCSIAAPGAALKEMRRVLKPAGVLLFVEHGWSPDPRVRAWQTRLMPVWKPLTGGCHLDRRIDELITAAGFRFVQIDRGYGGGPKPLGYLYRGAATPDHTRGGA